MSPDTLAPLPAPLPADGDPGADDSCSMGGLFETDVLDILMDRSRRLRLLPGESLFAQGDPADRFFLIRHGKVRLYTLEPGGNAVTLHVFGPGDFFGLPAMLGLRHYPVNGDAVTEAVVDVITRSTLFARLEEDGGRLMPLLTSLGRRHRTMTRSLAELKGISAFRRVCLWLWRELEKALPDAGTHPAGTPAAIRLQVPHYVIAGAVGLTPENFSRALRRLEKLGIHLHRGHLSVGDTAVLRQMAAADTSPED